MRAAFLGSVVFACSGCASIAHPSVPAVVVAPDALARTELHEAVAAALHRDEVRLAATALTEDSTLLIERAPARDVNSVRLTGRDFEKPERFDLLLEDDRCILVHSRTGARYELRKARCTPRKDAAPTR